jgi:hypothetical protein
MAQVDRARSSPFLEQETRNQKSAQHKKDIDANAAAFE